jgi:hypothetical protein
MNLSYKERMRRSVQHETVDRIPTQINYTPSLGEKMAQDFGISLEELPDRFGNHFLRVDLSRQSRLSEDGKTGGEPAFQPKRKAISPPSIPWPSQKISTPTPGPIPIEPICLRMRRKKLPLIMARILLRRISVLPYLSAPGRCEGLIICLWNWRPIPAMWKSYWIGLRRFNSC